MSIDFRSDPIGQRTKGWKTPPYKPKTRLVPGWEPRPEFGAGQEFVPDASGNPVLLDDGLVPGAAPEPFDWGAIRSAAFPELAGGPTPAPEPATAQPSVEPDPDLAIHLGGKPAPTPAASVYDPSQARVLSSSASPSKPPARPPATPTSAQAAGGPGGAAFRSKSQQEFIDEILPKAQEMGKKLNIPWQVLVAIPANETGWGSSVFHNNYFGIKGPGATARTWEVINGKRQDITDSFRTFGSPEESMQGFAALMYDNPRYSKALEQLQADPTNWPAFVSMIHTAGYATDPQWAQKIIRIGQGLESADSMPVKDMSKVTPSGGLLDTARSAIGTRGGVGGTQPKGEGYVFPVAGYATPVPDHWGEVKGGSDLFAKPGTHIMAMRGGKVLSAGFNKVGGNAVTIQGDDGLEYYYAHMIDAPLVKTGDVIKAGTLLGGVGETGNAAGKGAHLHIGIGPSIREGADKYGGTGGDFDAVGLMNSVLKGEPVKGAPTKGTYSDDASYVAWTYRNGIGRNLPSTIGAQYASSKPISAKDAQPGDLVMFNMNSQDPDLQHVAIYLGNGQMIHNNDGEVKQENVWGGGEFRRLSGIKIGDMGPVSQGAPTVANFKRVTKYVDNSDGTYTAHYQDGSTELVRRINQLAPVEGGRHPSTVGAKKSSFKGGAGQEAGTFLNPSTGSPEPIYDTYYHGTPAEFAKADPSMLYGINLYGPGYYLTENPNVAGGTVESGNPSDPEFNPTFEPGYVYKKGYSQKGINTKKLADLQQRLEQDENGLKHIQSMDPKKFTEWGTTQEEQLEIARNNLEHTRQQLSGMVIDPNGRVIVQPNVRKVGVPRNLKWFDMDTPLDEEGSRALANVNEGRIFMPNTFVGTKGHDAYKDALSYLVEDEGWSMDEAQDAITATLEDAGYHGISHIGGQRVGDVLHNVKVVFPENVDKIKNLLSGEFGGSTEYDPSLAPQQTDKDTDWTPIKPEDHPINQGEVAPTPPTDIGVDFAPKPPPQEPANKGEIKPQGPLINTGPDPFGLFKKPGGLPTLPGMPKPSFMGVGQEGFTSGGGGGSDYEDDPAAAGIGGREDSRIAEDPVDLMSDPNVRQQALRERGWNEPAVGQVSSVPTKVWGGSSPYERGQNIIGEATPPTPVPAGHEGPPAPGRIDMYSPNMSKFAGQTASTGETVSGPASYEHEAHHAWDERDPQQFQQRYTNAYDNAADVLEDLNLVRQHAAQSADRDLFDAVNDTMWLYHNDPVHANHYIGMLSRQQATPEWYRSKYFSYLQGNPQWTGAQAQSPEQSMLSPRVEGAESYEDEQLARAWQEYYARQDQRTPEQREEDTLRERQHLDERSARGEFSTPMGTGQEEEKPWWERLGDAGIGGAQAVLGGAGEAIGGAVQGAQQGLSDLGEQMRRPAELEPGQRPASQDVSEAVSNVGEALTQTPVSGPIGEAFSGLGSAARQVFPEPTPLYTPTGELTEYGRQKVEAEGPDPFAPVSAQQAAENRAKMGVPEPLPGGALARHEAGEEIGPVEAITSMVPEMFQDYNAARRKAIEEHNPVANVPVVGGAVNIAGDIATDPVQLGILAATGGSPILAGALTSAATAVEQPGATPLDVAVQGTVGAVVSKAAPLAGKYGGQAVNAISERAEPFVKAVADSPLSKFMLEESGAVGPVTGLKIGRNVLVGTQVGGLVGMAPDLTNPRTDDPQWWAQVADDYAHGATVGGAVTMGIPGMKYGLDKTITPERMKWFNNVFNPRANIPDAAAQVAAGTRANMINRARVGADIIREEGRQLFGKAGQGLNTAEAAAYAEEKRTLIGFVGKNGERVTPEQEAWLQKRFTYEDDANVRLNAAKILGPTQDVTTPLGDPGASVHITHLYEKEVNAAQQAAFRGRGGGGFGWRDSTIVKPRNKSSVDPTQLKTIREALDEYYRDSLKPKPLDDLITRFEVSAYQTEKAIANRNFYNTINPPGKNRLASPVVRPAKIAPDDWVYAKDEWGFGYGVKNKFKFEPKLAEYLDNVSGAAESAPWLQWFGEHVSAPLKGLLFAGSPVHAFNVAYRVISTTSPNQLPELFRGYIMPTVKRGYGELMTANPALALDAAEHGLTPSRMAAEGIQPHWGWAGQTARTGAAALTGGGAGWAQAKARGESDEQAWHQAVLGASLAAPMAVPGLGAGVVKILGKDVDVNAAASFADVIHHAIFREGMPAAKLGMYDILTRAGVDKNVAAASINNTIGGIDQTLMGRSPWVQDLMRYGMIAPDWTEGQVRTMANLFMPNQMGAHTRQSIAKGLGSYMAVIEGLNILFNGHPTWENGEDNKYKLEVTGLLNGVAALSGDPGKGSVDPTDKTPTRTFIDPMPPIRWMMETIDEGARELVYTQGQLEDKMPGHVQIPGLPAPTGSPGQRLMDFTGQDLRKGELPPDLPGKIVESAEQRIGPGPSMLGAAKEFIEKKQKAWTGEPLDPPDLSTPTGWGTWISHLVGPFAPATSTAALTNVDIAHPDWRANYGDALIEFLGFTRVNRNKELSRDLGAVDKVKKEFLGIDPMLLKDREEKHQAKVEENDAQRHAAFVEAETEDSKTTHGDIDSKMHALSDARKAFSRRQEIKEDFVNKAPDWAKDTIQRMMENAWNVSGDDFEKHEMPGLLQGLPGARFLEDVWNMPGQASPLEADLKPTTDVAELAKAYWLPPGVDVTDKQALSQARRNLLNDFAVTHNEDRDALEDLIKWQAQHQDNLSLATPPPPSLPGVTSGQLGQIATNYLQAGEDEHGNLIEDVDMRGDKMRAFLKSSAQQVGVTPEVLLERINLRLAGVGQTTPIERSYNTALQTFFRSRDEDQFPRYKNPDGSPMGDRAMWDDWDDKIHSMGINKIKKFEEWEGRVAAKEKADNDRDKYLLNGIDGQTRLDYERWFGIGRGMTERAWQDYVNDRTVGYEDLKLDADMNPPANETRRRDKIRQMYRAADADERIDTEVWVWNQGDYMPMNLNGANDYLNRWHINSPGRKLEDLMAHGELPEGSRPSVRLDTVESAAR